MVYIYIIIIKNMTKLSYAEIAKNPTDIQLKSSQIISSKPVVNNNIHQCPRCTDKINIKNLEKHLNKKHIPKNKQKTHEYLVCNICHYYIFFKSNEKNNMLEDHYQKYHQHIIELEKHTINQKNTNVSEEKFYTIEQLFKDTAMYL